MYRSMTLNRTAVARYQLYVSMQVPGSMGDQTLARGRHSSKVEIQADSNQEVARMPAM
jgi:hypothetical protein